MQADIERLFDSKPDTYLEEHFSLFDRFKEALNSGAIRAAEPDPAAKSGWRVNGWVKKGILLGFRMGALVDMSIDRERQPWFDKSTYPVKRLAQEDAVRIAMLVVKTRAGERSLLPAQISSINGGIRARVAASEWPAFSGPEGYFLLDRDLLDQQIIDINGRKVVRVNDVEIMPEAVNEHFVLKISAVDVGVRASV